MKINTKKYADAQRAVVIDIDAGRVYWGNRPRSDFASKGTYDAWHRRFKGMETGVSGGVRAGRVFAFKGTTVSVARLVARAAWGRRTDSKYIEHINGDNFDCRIKNLRLIDGTERRQKSKRKDGLPKGVYPRHGKFQSYRRVNGRLKFLGTFETADEAAQAFLYAGGR